MALDNFSRMMDALRDGDRMAEKWEELNRLVEENLASASANRDKSRSRADTGHMNDITREEFNARLETIEVKMDSRIESISSKIDGFLAAQIERDRRLDESIAGVRRDIDRLGNLKLNVWGAMLTAVGLGVAIAALSVTFYQTGKSDSSPAASVPPALSAPPAPPAKN